MSDDINKNWSVMLAISLFAAIVILIGWDLWVDYGEGASIKHLAVEFFVLLVAASGVLVMWFDLDQARSELVAAKAEAVQWRTENQDLVRGLGVAIQNQFSRWKLSKAEAEIGLLLLKGLSHKEIALVRQTSERTIREQARALYRKSGLSGRSSLSAFFLEDLLPQGAVQPTEQGASMPPS